MTLPAMTYNYCFVSSALAPVGILTNRQVIWHSPRHTSPTALHTVGADTELKPAGCQESEGHQDL